jgi:hypothetical protein
MTGCGARDETAETPVNGVFTDVTAAAGLEFAIDRSVADDYFMPDSMGTGCAFLDYDADGDLDIYLVNGFRDASGAVVTDAGANRLYRQEPGPRFVDVTAEAGVGDRGYGMGVATGDVDNDGDVDLFVTNFGPDVLYRNEGDGTFTDVTAAAGVGERDAWSASAAFLDYDGDGHLDLFVTTYLDYAPGGRSRDAGGRDDYPAPAAFPGLADDLFRNEGDGTFTNVSVATGIAARPGRGLGVVTTDLDDDGRPDVFVANDGDPNAAWINDGRGGFTDRAHAMGLAVNAYGMPEASMGIAVGDTDGNGRVDLFLTHLFRESSTLYRQRLPGFYEDGTMAAGLTAPSIDFTGFGTAFLDVEHDGDLDIVVANGRILRASPFPGVRLVEHWAPYAEPNQLLLNDGSGRFDDAGPRGGAFTRDLEVGRGLAVGDVDGDGDVDLLVANGNGTLRLYRNDAPRAGRWLTVRVVDPGLRRDAIGAVVALRCGNRLRRREITTAGSYLSAHDPRAHFGLASNERVDEMVVRWPDGARERFDAGGLDRRIELRRGAGRPLDRGNIAEGELDVP